MVQAWQQRVKDERNELGSKLAKLGQFLSDDENLKDITPKDIGLLIAQRAVMAQYYEILCSRIDRFA